MDPSRIGSYIVERELGSGGMGTVYLGHHAETGRRVAVKVLPASLSREPGFVARFNREIDALHKVQSPHIVELFESDVEGETYFYAMEFVDGETLTERLDREKRLPWRLVIDIAVQVCRALKAAHNAGVIHRDLKPSNLMLSVGDQVKLTDFGVAQIFAGGKLTATGGVVGTAEYMSPEQAEGKRATKQSDIYALGAVMYVMLTGRPPFTGKTALDIAQKHRFGQFDSPRRFVPEIPTWLDEVVCKCLAKNPDQRYPDAYVLSLRLQEIPRKVELANSDESLWDGRADAKSETVAAAPTPPTAGDASPELGGTFVRDVVRAELDRVANRTPLESLLDSTWVLLLALAGVIVGGVWLYQRRTIDPEALFTVGEQRMQAADRSEWLLAEAENFQPLLALDSATWEPRIAPHRTKLALAAREQELHRRLRRRGDATSPESEPLRILDRIARDIDDGEWVSARTRLEALRSVLADDDGAAVEREVVSDLLERLPKPATDHHNPLVDGVLKRAAQAASAGRPDEARRLLENLAALYRDDPAAAEDLRRVEQQLAALPAANP
jgi:serine/threonine-protein kinase